MYIVEIYNGDVITPIHYYKEKLESGKIVKGINTIDSFTFSMMPDNPGFKLINEFTTIVKVYNSNVSRTEFVGRVLYAETTMDEDGFIIKTVTCESVAGYLCDSVQKYVSPKNWSLQRLLVFLINQHNSQVEEYKQITIVDSSFLSSVGTVYEGIQRENTWDAIKTKILDKVGGELQINTDENNKVCLSVVEKIGELKETEIALSVNMKSITQEKDPSAFITRLIPLGCKLKDENEEETENRLDISDINGGLDYIDDEEAIAVYGIHVGVVEWDDVTVAENLITKGREWLKDNNKVQIKYSVSALDLSLIGLAVDDFEIGNTHPIKNELLNINDTARIIKQTIDICEEVESTIEVGDNFKTLSDIQREQAQEIQAAAKKVNSLELNSSMLVQNLNAQLEAFSKKITTFEEKVEKIRQSFADDESDVAIESGSVTFKNKTLVVSGALSGYNTDAENKADLIGVNSADEVELGDKDFATVIKGKSISAPNLIQTGSDSITPEEADTVTTKTISFKQAFQGVPKVFITPIEAVTGIGVSSVDSTGFTVWLTQSDTTETNFNWLAVYEPEYAAEDEQA